MTDLTTAKAFDPNDPASVAERQKAIDLRAIQNKRVIGDLLGTASGRNWVWSILERTHFLSTSFTSDPQTMAFQEGERNIGLVLWAQINSAAPDLVSLMLTEKGSARG
jgi:hypothetical protein